MKTKDFTRAIAHCLSYPHEPEAQLIDIVKTVLESDDPPDRATLESLQARIAAVPGANSEIALVYGGATKIKGYVFEAAKLQEVRGASALLDWVNEVALCELWRSQLGAKLADDCVILASGGSFLAFAPAAKEASLATAVEHAYTAVTLTANSAAVSETFSLLELRYGLLPPRSPGADQFYWVEDFVADCAVPEQWAALQQYYYPPERVQSDDTSEEALRRRFLNRKTFGELVTLLATRFNTRRDERAKHGPERVVPSYPLLPWAAKCDSSDVRPAVVSARVGDDRRELSEASARKLVVGRVIKKGDKEVINALSSAINWWVPKSLEDRSWEQRWNTELAKYTDSPYLSQYQGNWLDLKPAPDVHEIGAASNGYIGLIYADGNNIGRLMATLTTPQKYYKTSQNLRDAARNAVFAVLREHLRPAGGYHPFEILTIGGDDLMLIVPGNRALDIALTLGRAFEHELARTLREEVGETPVRQPDRYNAPAQTDDKPIVGLSAGVVIAQENAPIFFLDRLVSELLKNAKKLARYRAQDHYPSEEPGAPRRPKPHDFGGAIDFMVLKSITMVTDNITAFRREAFGDYDPTKVTVRDAKTRLTARPYTWNEFAGLLAVGRVLASERVPRSQLYRLRGELVKALQFGITTSVMEYLYTLARLNKHHRDAIQAAIGMQKWQRDTHHTPLRTMLPPWLPRSANCWETIWSDLLEIAEMLPEKP